MFLGLVPEAGSRSGGLFLHSALLRSASCTVVGRRRRARAALAALADFVDLAIASAPKSSFVPAAQRRQVCVRCACAWA